MQQGATLGSHCGIIMREYAMNHKNALKFKNNVLKIRLVIELEKLPIHGSMVGLMVEVVVS